MAQRTEDEMTDRTVKGHLFDDMQAAAMIVERLSNERQVLGYSLTVVMAQDDGSVRTAHSAVVQDDPELRQLVAGEIAEKFAESFPDHVINDDDDPADEED